MYYIEIAFTSSPGSVNISLEGWSLKTATSLSELIYKAETLSSVRNLLHTLGLPTHDLSDKELENLTFLNLTELYIDDNAFFDDFTDEVVEILRNKAVQNVENATVNWVAVYDE